MIKGHLLEDPIKSPKHSYLFIYNLDGCTHSLSKTICKNSADSFRRAARWCSSEQHTLAAQRCHIQMHGEIFDFFSLWLQCGKCLRDMNMLSGHCTKNRKTSITMEQICTVEPVCWCLYFSPVWCRTFPQKRLY